MFIGKRLIYTAKFVIREMLISGLILICVYQQWADLHN